MYPSTQSIHPVQSIFGAGYVPETHGDDVARNLPQKELSDIAEFVERLTTLCFGERH